MSELMGENMYAGLKMDNLCPHSLGHENILCDNSTHLGTLRRVTKRTSVEYNRNISIYHNKDRAAN